MGQPLVSIVTPSYEQGEYIEDTLRSVARQHYANVEHIVIDGGSNDSTIEVLERHEDQYDLRWISEPDDGQSDAINKGFARAKGDYVGWINSDDFYFDRDVVTAAVQQFTSKPSLDVLYGSIAYIDDQSRIERFQPAPPFDSGVLRGHNYIPQPGVFFDGEVVAEYSLRTDLVFCMDYDYWLRLAAEDHTISAIPRVMAAYRMHVETKGQSLGLARLREEHQQLRQEYGTPPRFRELGFKLKRNLREVIFNLRRLGCRGRRPPVLRGEAD